MSRVAFKRAVRREVKLRVALMGPSGGGKTYSALALATHLVDDPDAIFVADSEVSGTGDQAQGSAEKYVGDWCRCSRCQGHGKVFGFQSALLPKGSQTPNDYVEAIAAAAAAGAKVLILDSITHEWEACLELVDGGKGPNKFAGWAKVTPLHDRFVQAVLTFPGHVICTMRTKDKHKQEGKEIVSLGELPVQRVGIEYEFDIALFVSGSRARVVKSRAAALTDRIFDRPGRELAELMLAWANTGEAQAPRPTDELAEKVRALLPQLDAETAAKAREFFDAHRGDAAKLQQLLARVEAKLAAPPPAAPGRPPPPGALARGHRGGQRRLASRRSRRARQPGPAWLEARRRAGVRGGGRCSAVGDACWARVEDLLHEM
ncbi:MAG: AAA family ATPase [Planctomycetota bacterium]|nr:AAA family ATPase [Planctomycetota bacterium]